jgi:hypothetical protein
MREGRLLFIFGSQELPLLDALQVVHQLRVIEHLKGGTLLGFERSLGFWKTSWHELEGFEKSNCEL